MLDIYMLYRLLPRPGSDETANIHELISKSLDLDIKLIKNDLQQAFSLCKNIYTKEMLWKQFFAANDLDDKKQSEGGRNLQEKDTNSKNMGNA